MTELERVLKYTDGFHPDWLLCATAAKAEGATWDQINEMFWFPDFKRAMGHFCAYWVPDWSPSFRYDSPAMMRAVVRNYIQKSDPNYRAPEWMAN